jgi:hypothetical protein
MTKRISWILLLGLIGCGDKEEPPEEKPNPAVEARLNIPEPPVDSTPGADTVQAKGVQVFVKNSKMTLSSYQLATGDVDFTLANTEDQQHILEIKWEDGARWRTIPVGKGGRVSLTATLNPGKYEVYCPVPGHKEAGEYTSFRAGPKPETTPLPIQIDTLPQHPPQPGPDPASRAP